MFIFFRRFLIPFLLSFRKFYNFQCCTIYVILYAILSFSNFAFGLRLIRPIFSHFRITKSCIRLFQAWKSVTTTQRTRCLNEVLHKQVTLRKGEYENWMRGKGKFRCKETEHLLIRTQNERKGRQIITDKANLYLFTFIPAPCGDTSLIVILFFVTLNLVTQKFDNFLFNEK